MRLRGARLILSAWEDTPGAALGCLMPSALPHRKHASYIWRARPWENCLYLVILNEVRWYPEPWKWLLAKLKRTGTVPRLGTNQRRSGV